MMMLSLSRLAVAALTCSLAACSAAGERAAAVGIIERENQDEAPALMPPVAPAPYDMFDSLDVPADVYHGGRAVEGYGLGRSYESKALPDGGDHTFAFSLENFEAGEGWSEVQLAAAR